MADLATLGIQVKYDSVRGANDNLDRLGKTARTTSKATDELSGSIRGGASALAAIDGPLGGVAGRFRALGATVRQVGPLFAGLAIAVAGVGFAASGGVSKTMAFQDALAEVSTLVDTTTFKMSDLKKAALEQSIAFGTTPVEQTKAFYQIISAGASSAAQATDILTAANKLAVGGVTDIKTAADGLTSVLNAYGDKVESATAVSDSMFVAMRAGKTTIGELSGALGRVAPLAAQTGVSFDELTAAVSALTKGGISTAESMTGVRAILAAVAKPTSEATKMAHALGLEFDAAALKSKGFAAFLQDVVTKSHGNTAVLAQLFGGVEALVPVMALAGQAGKDFTDILGQMTNKAGSTDAAVDKMKTTSYELGRVWSAITVQVEAFWDGPIQRLAPVLKAVADNMGGIVSVATDLAAIVGVVLVARLAGYTAALVANAASAAIATAGQVAFEIAVGATSVTSLIAAGSVRVLTAALSFFGGPIGLAITAIAGAIYLVATHTSAATKAQDSYNEAMDAANGIFGTATERMDKMIQKQREDAVSKTEAAIKTNELALATAQLNLQMAHLARWDTLGTPAAIKIMTDLTGQVDTLTAHLKGLQSNAIDLRYKVDITPQVKHGATSPANDNWKPPSAGAADRSGVLQHELTLLQQQGQAERLIGDARDVQIAQSKVQQKLYQDLKTANKDLSEQQLQALSKLNPAEAEQVRQIVLQSNEWKRQTTILEAIKKPLDDYVKSLQAINDLQRAGQISPLQASVAKSKLQMHTDTLGLQQSVGAANPFGPAAQMGLDAATTGIKDEQKQRQLQAQEALQAGQIQSLKQYQELRIAIDADANAKILAAHTAFEDAKLKLGEDTFAGLSQGLGDMFGKQSAAYKAAFAVEKAFQIARATLALETSIAQAAAAPWPTNIPAIAAAIANMSQILSAVASVSGSGFADGVVGISGRIGGSSSDTIPAWLTPGESVITKSATQGNRQTLAAMNAGMNFDYANNSPSSKPANMNIKIVQQPGVAVDVVGVTEDQVELIATRVVHRKAEKVVADRQKDPNSRIAKTMGQTLKAPRRRA